MIHFQVGTPRGFLSRERLLERHPEVGMERYIRKLCAQYEIENYEITLINMVAVDSISVTEKGMTCHYGPKVAAVSQAEYQTDEEILEHSGYTNTQCLNNIRSFPNIDYDGKLLEKYERRYEIERRKKAQKEMIAKQIEADKHQRAVENQKRDMIEALKKPMLITIKNTLKEHRTQFNNESKGNTKIFNKCCFLVELLNIVNSGNLGSLQEMKKLPYFEQVTGGDSLLSFFSKKKSEIGTLFNEAEQLLIQIQELCPEKATDSRPTRGNIGDII